ncbi:hypothetical protein Rrhod_2118 [Rhodococcus rhodnii LMG 5362]|uniref:Uncharacterized protein n=1 Tax=Rhodococcus rhodnii LMG 5362 TaxID=1273125 RepID=R7WMQ5_9NOCA|nr:hypothetical protein Rrhod_2118 [Rhodococcus rhodnii LMG 5362]
MSGACERRRLKFAHRPVGRQFQLECSSLKAVEGVNGWVSAFVPGRGVVAAQ